MMSDTNQKNKNDLKKRAYVYALNLIKFVDGLNKKDLGVQILSRQLMRSGTSIGANIVEAQAGSSRKDFTNFFLHSLKSANESSFWLGLLRDSRKADGTKADILIGETRELANILGSSVVTLRKRG
ncbi:MAG: four helix bundle protein [Patescibacteria group bacterium]